MRKLGQVVSGWLGNHVGRIEEDPTAYCGTLMGFLEMLTEVGLVSVLRLG